MSASKKLIIALFIVIFITTLGLLYIYYSESRKQASEVITLSKTVRLVVNDQKKFTDFLTNICNCKAGEFKIYEISNQHPAQTVKSVVLTVVDERQNNRVSSVSSSGQTGKTLYTYGFRYNKENSQAVISLNFPYTQDEKTVLNAVLLTVYKLFNGQPLTQPDAKLASYTSLEMLGLEYDQH